VPQDHPSFGEALGSGGPDLVLPLDFEHPGAGQAGVEGGQTERHREPGQEQTLRPGDGVLGQGV
jgi:hypothetical protein